MRELTFESAEGRAAALVVVGVWLAWPHHLRKLSAIRARSVAGAQRAGPASRP